MGQMRFVMVGGFLGAGKTTMACNLAIAIALVLLTLLPLGLRAAGIVMVAIPLSFAFGLTALNFLGYSLNQISIAAFVVALGLLVDDSIVVTENIARHLREGAPRAQAALAGTDGILMDLDTVGSIFELVFLPLDLPGKLSLFAGHHHAAIEVVRQRSPDDEPARFDGHDLVDGGIAIVSDELVDGSLETPRVLQQRRDIAELDAGLRKIGDRPDQRLELVHSYPRRLG